MAKKPRPLSSVERRDRICRQIAQSEGEVRTGEILKALPGVSGPLLAIDLNWLVEQGKIARVGHGIYTANRAAQAPSWELPLFAESLYRLRLSHEIREKQSVARYIARNFFQRDGSYGLDAGSTLTVVFQELVANRPASEVEIVTNNVHGALLVSPSSHFRLTLVGGEVSLKYACTTGELGRESVKSLRASVIGFSRITARRGPWTADSEQWPWKKALCAAAKQVVFAGTLDRLGDEFDGESMQSLEKLNYTLVVDSNSAKLDRSELKRVERERKEFGERLVLVDEDGLRVDELKKWSV